MKLAQVLLVNVATVAVALFAYEQVRESASVPSTGRVATSRNAGVAELEARVHALEIEARTWREAAGAERLMPDRIEAPEQVAQSGAAPGTAIDRGPAADSGKPTSADVDRFRSLQNAVRRQNIIKKNRKRIESALDNLSINLTPAQRQRVHAEVAEFEPNIVRIWGEVKTEARATIEAGGEVDRGQIVSSTQTRIQNEFAATLTGIVNHPADAQAIAQAVHPGAIK